MKIGVLLPRFPYPLEKGDKLRAYHQIKELSKKHEIYLCTLHVGKKRSLQLDQLAPYCKEIKVIRISRLSILLNLTYSLLFTKLPLQVAYFFNRSKKKKILSFFDHHQIDHLYCQLIRIAEYVKDYDRFPKTLDYMDALSRGMMRRLEVSPLYLRPFIKIETTRLKRYEHFIFDSFDHLTIISEQDRDLIVHADNKKIDIIRNGVDQDFFKPKPEMEKEIDLLFTGNMSYPPNVDTAEFLANELMPRLLKKKPKLKLVLAGANPSSRVRALKSKQIEVTGWVDDIRDSYAKAKVFVAPLRIGSGLQNKLLEAMAMEIPCITSALANNALGAIDGESILIAKDLDDLENKVIELLEEEDKARELAKKGYEFVSRNYNWESSTAKLEALFLATNK